MKVKELIKKLELLPEDAPVIISGFEGGFNELKSVKHPFNIKFNVNKSYLRGPHEETDENSADITAVLIGERRR